MTPLAGETPAPDSLFTLTKRKNCDQHVDFYERHPCTKDISLQFTWVDVLQLELNHLHLNEICGGDVKSNQLPDLERVHCNWQSIEGVISPLSDGIYRCRKKDCAICHPLAVWLKRWLEAISTLEHFRIDNKWNMCGEMEVWVDVRGGTVRSVENQKPVLHRAVANCLGDPVDENKDQSHRLFHRIIQQSACVEIAATDVHREIDVKIGQQEKRRFNSVSATSMCEISRPELFGYPDTQLLTEWENHFNQTDLSFLFRSLSRYETVLVYSNLFFETLNQRHNAVKRPLSPDDITEEEMGSSKRR
ncbi:hypothetical protein PROFUN_08390 [Planoprotostelium fungivorum]|uniref:Uncharacterized protein n=1 Tax=Planoprotostelium fungivorum TaxID=1890364 RepID=A0A2P6NJS1_9EUKA|nr:hypothetical protein PROFUN_08390 [Planoprotostelium fungivorum]